MFAVNYPSLMWFSVSLLLTTVSWFTCHLSFLSLRCTCHLSFLSLRCTRCTCTKSISQIYWSLISLKCVKGSLWCGLNFLYFPGYFSRCCFPSWLMKVPLLIILWFIASLAVEPLDSFQWDSVKCLVRSKEMSSFHRVALYTSLCTCSWGHA